MQSKEAKEFEEKYKEILFRQIREMCSELTQYIMDLQEIDSKNKLPNLGITLNNKLIELQKEFEKAGLSMFVEEREGYPTDSFLGDAIIADLLDYMEQAIHNLDEYTYSLQHSFEENMKQNSIWEKIKSWFQPHKQTQPLLTAGKTNLQTYQKIDEKLWNYNLRENIVSSVAMQIKKKKYNAYYVPSIVKEFVIPDLQKLGLDDLIPDLEEKIVEEYKKDLPDPEIYAMSKEDMYLFVPDFSRKDESFPIQNQTRNIEENTITLEDLAFIDRTVNALERQLGIQAIQKERTQPTQENQKEDKEISK